MTQTTRTLRLAVIFGLTAVAIGAFGAHGLKSAFEARQLDTRYLLGIYEKGVQYQFYHTLALGLVALLLHHRPDSKWLVRASALFVAGILLFSGSLYLLACRDLLPFPVGWAGPVTPVGGLCFIAGWAALLWATFEKP
ncbi:MAG: DUF423 domain-containing protein [Saprospiraceae bacterium]|nr:DUF423 domain-containing protein [Saprospiraceae bacterium]